MSRRALGAQRRIVVALAAITLLAAVCWSFAPVVHAPWLSWDDAAAFFDETRWRGLGPAQLQWMWTTFAVGIYRPVTWMSYGLDFLLWELDAGAYHRTGLLLHVVNTALVGRLGVVLLRRTGAGDAQSAVGGWMSAALFGLHPLRAEVVGWISARADLLATAFALLSTLAYLSHTREDRGRWWRSPWMWCSALCFVASLLSKSSAIALPLVFLALDALVLGRGDGTWRRWWELVTEKTAMFVAALAMVPISLLSKSASVPGITGSRALLGVTIASYALVFYLRASIAPVGLSAMYEFPPIVRVADPRFVVPLLLVLIAVIAGWRLRGRIPLVVAAGLSFALLLLPVSGLLPFGPQLVADRYTYLTTIPLALLAGGAMVRVLERLSSRPMRNGVAAMVVVILVLLSGMTRRQSALWASEAKLWAQAAQRDTNSALAAGNLAIALVVDGKAPSALPYAQRVARLRPRSASDRGLELAVLLALGESAAAANAVHRAREDEDITSEIFREAADVLISTDRVAQSLELYALAVQADPRSRKAANGYASALAMDGRLELAVGEFKRAIAIDSTYAEPYNNLGNALLALGRKAEALESYQKSVLLAPDNPEARVNLGDALVANRLFAEAIDQYERAIKLVPDHARAYNNLGFALLQSGRAREAVTALRRAVEIEPNVPGGRQNLEAALSASGNR